MIVLDINNIGKSYLSEPILERISCKLEQGEKIGLIGANGCGKSTLLKLIAGVEDPSTGVITRPTGATVGYLAQEMEYGQERTVRQEILSVFADIEELSSRLKTLEQTMADPQSDARQQQRALDQYSHLAAEFERLGGYTVEHRVDAVLDGLRLAGRQDQPVASLSGGEKNIVALAKVLLEEPDILLLDEPANHLDFEGLDWLENFLNNSDRTVVLVSHNRYLLDRVVGSILEIENGQLTRYAGNYSWYRAEKMKNLLAQQAAYQDQQKEICRLEEMIVRFERWASMTNDPRQARRAKNKQRTLDRMDKIDRPDLDPQRIDPAFAASTRGGDIALELKGYSRSFGDRILFDRVDLHLSSGDRVGLLGPNGTGKSTLFRDIVGQAAWDDPVLRVGPRVRIGYYSQEHETLDPRRTIMRELLELPGVTRDRAFSVLSRFLFRWEDMDRVINTLSGGEKSRVQLAKLMISDVNLLLLDEPTNHLDVFSRERVEEALEEFAGALLVISHDRYFLDRIVGRIVEIDNPCLREYPGDFSYYWRKKKAATSPPRPPRRQKQVPVHKKRQPVHTPNRPVHTPNRPVHTPNRPVHTPDRAQTAEIEAEIEARETRKRQLEADLAAAYHASDHRRGDRLTRELHRLENEIDRLYADWEQQVP